MSVGLAPLTHRMSFSRRPCPDILAIRDDEVLGVQATSGDHVAERVAKIAEHENIGPVRKAGIRIEVWGWRKNTQGRWVLREVDCS